MVFLKHKEGRKNNGRTSANQTVNCYKCGKNIDFGEPYYSKVKNPKCNRRPIEYICDPCYEGLWIDL